MDKFTVLQAIAAPLMIPNIDTDRIIRIEHIVSVPRERQGDYMLEAMRFNADGSDNPGFILNRPPFRDARILIAAENFGCGSSRENAVWALYGWGLRCVIAPSFGDIFYGNCFQNGLLPIRLPAATVEKLAVEIADGAGDSTLTVDLEQQRIVTARGEVIPFEVEPLRRKMLLEGLDEIGLTLQHEHEIAAFQQRDRAARPWLYGN
ncbi:MAG: 3-isopropylmalate dehydratase small subunit [Betaproteobacteria bacterium]|nr:3-isopropylmalate dehydratase small subunit [Betaproteobacteria bacterium]